MTKKDNGTYRHKDKDKDKYETLHKSNKRGKEFCDQLVLNQVSKCMP